MSRAWYAPRPFSVVPIGRSSGPAPSAAETAAATEASDEDSDDDVKGIVRTCAYLRERIAEAVAEQGVKPERVVVAGFSQGGAVSLAMGLGVGLEEGASSPPPAGVACLSGYLPSFKLPKLSFPAEGPQAEQEGIHAKGGTLFFLAHGTKDMLVPGWVARQRQDRVREIVGEERVRTKMYQGMGHVVRGEEMRDFGEWLESVVGA